MPFKITVGGVEIIASTTTEAIALAREAGAIKRKPGRPPKSEADKAQEKKSDGTANAVLKFLISIQGAGAAGAGAGIVAKALGIKKQRGIGAKCRPINKFLSDLGYDHKTVYSNERVIGEGRFWKSGPQMQSALGAINAANMLHKE